MVQPSIYRCGCKCATSGIIRWWNHADLLDAPALGEDRWRCTLMMTKNPRIAPEPPICSREARNAVRAVPASRGGNGRSSSTHDGEAPAKTLVGIHVARLPLWLDRAEHAKDWYCGYGANPCAQFSSRIILRQTCV
jgi:hypothetical protein